METVSVNVDLRILNEDEDEDSLSDSVLVTVIVLGTQTVSATASVVSEPFASVTVTKCVIVEVVVGCDSTIEVAIGVTNADPNKVTVL